MNTKTPITVAYGDGIGPEIMTATLSILEAAGARLTTEVIEIGEKVYQRGNTSGIEASSWESLRRTKVFLKAPITTPQGGGFKSLNVTTRKTLGLYANVRPCVSYHPFVATKHPVMDLVIVRENEEDLYAGIEYRLTDDVYQCLKLITRPGSEKIVRYAFEYARANGRKKVTCFTKDNIMKLTDGLFHRVFDEIGALYPDLEKEHWIVDIGAAKLADTPEAFDVIVMPNLYGDILSDVAAQIAGSVGLAGSANIGVACAMFEAIHGSAPRRAGQNVANPSGLLLGAVMMLVHIGQRDVAEKVHNAWLCTIEDGVHTYDVFEQGVSRQKVGTREFAAAVVERIGRLPEKLKAVHYAEAPPRPAAPPAATPRGAIRRETVGVDVYVSWKSPDSDALAARLAPLAAPGFKLTMMTSRGVKVWPDGAPETMRVDECRCRFLSLDGAVAPGRIVELLGRIAGAGLEFVKIENLQTFDGDRGFSMGQGE
ncbi:MAG TPA: NADP-dependent isocitrate dehydrogenase [Thermoanaerobaculia bacterium]|nr:NADP-dependent isocitrate dehydrogenase [Thermoanaerobaculia bacterium]